MTNYYYCSECDNTVAFGHDCPSDMGKAFYAETSYMSPQGYVDPTSKYYIDRMWEEYHKLKEELADTKSKLAQAEDLIDVQQTLIKQIHKDEDVLIQAIERLTLLVEAAKELNTSYHDVYAVNRVRKAYQQVEETWEDVRARCS